jgi:diguanylate cyclase (GGDEF)-like protein
MSEEEELFRLGGDEFVIISTRKKAFVPKFVEKLESVVIGPHQIGKISVNIELSLGIAFYPDDTKDAMKLTRYADEAMYKAKKDINVYHKYYNEM